MTKQEFDDEMKILLYRDLHKSGISSSQTYKALYACLHRKKIRQRERKAHFDNLLSQAHIQLSEIHQQYSTIKSHNAKSGEK